MSAPEPRRRRSKARRVVTAIHKWLGLGSALIIVIISVTGILLNHSNSLNLDQSETDSRWMLDWYGLSPEGEPRGFQVGDHWLVELDEEFFFDAEPSGSEGRLIGAGMLNGEFIAVFESTALIFDETGQLVEKLDSFAPEQHSILRAGIAENELAVETKHGNWQLPGFLAIEQVEDREVEWFEPDKLPKTVREQVESAFSGDGLPVSRVVLDLHSGRLFGSIGVVIYDLAAIAFLVLAGTGVWLGLRKRRNQRRVDGSFDDKGPFGD
ncbi:MAG: hypothetical protein ACI8UO_000242 [Verrucomicrobiales bacterium]|jgi:hypothetical protein